MKNKKKLATTIFGVICVIVVLVCIVIQVVIAKKDKDLVKESEKYKTMIAETKSGKKIETEYIHVDDCKFYIKIPKNFKKLNYEEITNKYNGNVPNIVFSNDELTINIAISVTDNKMADTEIKAYQEYIEDLLKSNNEIMETKNYQVDNHNIGKIRLISKTTNTNIYNNMIFFSYQGKLVIITFNCKEELKEEWKSVGDFIIDSLFFKE